MLVLNFFQVSYILSYVLILGGRWEKTYCSNRKATKRASESAGGALLPAGRASDQAGGASDPAGRAPEPALRVLKPALRASDPVDSGTETKTYKI